MPAAHYPADLRLSLTDTLQGPLGLEEFKTINWQKRVRASIIESGHFITFSGRKAQWHEILTTEPVFPSALTFKKLRRQLVKKDLGWARYSFRLTAMLWTDGSLQLLDELERNSRALTKKGGFSLSWDLDVEGPSLLSKVIIAGNKSKETFNIHAAHAYPGMCLLVTNSTLRLN